jgi:endonuclease-8
LNFYAGDVKIIKENPDEVYDWSADIMNDRWNAKKAIKKLSGDPDQIISDSLLNQEIFSGVGNIIKSESLFRAKLHPRNKVGKIPPTALKLLLKETRKYSFDFLKRKKEGTLQKHWQVYSKKICPHCDIQLHKEILGKSKRRTFFCNNCQVLYK